MDPPPRSRDINGDGKVSVTDALSFLLLARSHPENTRLDWNLDGKFDQADIILLLKDLIAPDRGAALAANKADEKVEGRGGMRTREETARLLRLGQDGL